ncbi:unnamed protein product [Candidula unifasciata]|uniref:Uncharacterized protein n=1 Tax=Candidula unifasciata TaxID=100452 RepID=A0A8S3Z346_9EUPU|nr:unnamed protein product [Candidula unifasciata]
MDITGAKLLTGSVFFLVAVCFSFLPLCAIRWYLRRRGCTLKHPGAGQPMLLVQCLYSLASGVLIGTCLIHLLPESLETFQKAISSSPPQNTSKHAGRGRFNSTDNESSAEDLDTDNYPVAELLVALGFIAVYMLDNGLKSCSKERATTDYIESEIVDEDVVFLTPDESSSDQNTEARDAHCCQNKRGSGRRHGHIFSQLHHMLAAVSFKMPRSTVPYTKVGQTDGEAGEERLPAILELDSTDPDCVNTTLPNGPLDSVADVRISERDSTMFPPGPRTTANKAQESTQSKHLRSAALVAALCVHGFFDGIVVGLQTSVSVVLSLAFAISLHKSFVCVGLSLSLLRMGEKSTSPLSTCVSVLLFALSSPVGVLVSGSFMQQMFEQTGNGGTSMIPACLQSFAVGTFMYVAVLEVTERQRSRTLCVEIIQQMFLLFGFGLMAELRALLGDS